MEQVLECELMKRSSRNLQVAIAVPLGLIMGYLLINFVNLAFDKRLFIRGFFVPAILLFVVGLIAEALIWYFTKGKLVVYKDKSGNLEIEVSFPSQESDIDKGSWTTEAMYIKTYAKYGMYTKHLALSLACNGRPLYLLRQQLGGMQSSPDHFRLVNALYNPGGTEYWCKKTVDLEALIRQSAATV